MRSKDYKWKRFWCSRAGSIRFDSAGYLADPDANYGYASNPDVVTFDSLSSYPCITLLAEPGIGKSHAMETEWEAVRHRVEQESGLALFLDLRSYGDESRLMRDLFQSSTFTSWLSGEGTLHVYLDSLDECQLQIRNIATILIAELKKLPVERLRLRVACRTADWPSYLENSLRERWGENEVGVYELAPLRRVDVVEAAKAKDVDIERFLDEVAGKEVVPFAIKPVTLNLLLNTYRKNDRLPSTQAELYLDGCRLLCEEVNGSRRASGHIGNLTADQRLEVAARIAAGTVLAGRAAVRVGIDWGHMLDEDVPVRDLVAGEESSDGGRFQVDAAAIEETLSTGLFSSGGPDRMGWAHQTYAEFLAAHYLTRHGMALPQIMTIFVHPDDPEGKLATQLHETAAWLAGMEPAVFREIMRVDPEVLLWSDVATAEAQDKAALVENLLRLYDEEKLLDANLDVSTRYGKLAHPGLAEQLKPYIRDDNKGFVVRRVAIDIAEACEVRALQEDIVRVALDSAQPLEVREVAADYVARVGDERTRAELKPLALGEAGDDPNDQLKGYGLRAVWPGHMDAEELFGALAVPKNESFYGAYHVFVTHELAEALRSADLPAALAWVQAQQHRHALPYSFRYLMDDVMLKSWEHLEASGVLEAFAKAVLSRLMNHEAIVEDRDDLLGISVDLPFRDRLEREDRRRRLVLEAVLFLLTDSEDDPLWLVYSSTPLATSKDVPWLVEHFLEATSDEKRRLLARLIKGAFDQRDEDHFELIYSVSQSNPLLAEEFAWLLEPVELNSPEAQQMREYYEKSQALRERRENQRPLVEPPPAERIAKLLNECEAGDPDAWWRLNMDMTLEPDSKYYGNDLKPDLTILPGWKAADPLTRARIIAAAGRYVLEGDPQTHEWLGKNIYYRPALAGYKALRLLAKEDPGFVSDIPTEVWRRWTPVILSYPTSSGFEDEAPHRELVEMAYPHAPAEAIETLLFLIDKQDEEQGHISIMRKVEGCWDERLADALLGKAQDERLKPSSMGLLLSELLKRGVDGAREFAESLVDIPLPPDGDARYEASQ